MILSYLCKVHSQISHSGIIESVAGDCVKVRILQTSACAACKVAAHCSASESKEKIVDVFNVRNTASLKVGDPVMVSASRDVAGRADGVRRQVQGDHERDLRLVEAEHGLKEPDRRHYRAAGNAGRRDHHYAGHRYEPRESHDVYIRAPPGDKQQRDCA